METRRTLAHQICRMVFLCIWLANANISIAQQTPFLERTITISFQNERLDAALARLAKQGGFTFSYSPTVVDVNKVVTQQFTNKSIREILDELFSGTIQYKAKGKYLILTKAQLSQQKEKQVYTGYVVDESTGEKLKDVTVFDPISLSSTTTNKFGYFEIKIDKPPTDLKLAINKKDYSDTVVAVPSRNGRLLNIPMRVNKQRFKTFADSVESKMVRLWHKTKLLARQRITLENVDDTLHRKFQVSFVPFIGTNRGLSGNVINDYSYNIIGGISRGNRKLELGGVFNTVLGDVTGFQFAGVFNAVGGSVRGAQVAGTLNVNRRVVDGFQLAGVTNLNFEGSEKFSGAGVMNISVMGSRAVQLAGVGNITAGDQSRPHLAGVFNMTAGTSSSQLAGTFNLSAKDIRGVQVAGLFNLAGKSVRGVQLSGVFNLAGKEVRGAQVAGVFNFAKKVKGVQVGLLNISDSIKGVPIGLLSIVFKGYHKIEVSADELFYTNLAFRTGVHSFYNIITVGAKPSTFQNDSTFWTFGYGIGTAPRLSRKLFLNVDLISNQIMQGGSTQDVNLLNKVYVGVDYQFAKKMSLALGATLNAYTTDNEKDNYWNIFSDYKPDFISDKNSSHYNTKMWIGAKVGLRFL